MNPNTPIGDLMHHKGRLIDIRILGDGSVQQRTVQFDGYQSFLAALAGIDVSATEGANGALVLASTDATAFKHDWWAVTTNLLQWPDRNRVMLDLKAGGALNNATPSVSIDPVTLGSASYDYTYSLPGEADEFGNVPLGEAVTVTLTQRLLQQNRGTLQQIPIHRTTVSEVLTLDWAGHASYPGQDTDYATFEDRELVLTPFGLVLKANLVIPLVAPFLTDAELPTGYDHFDVTAAGVEAQPVLRLLPILGRDPEAEEPDPAAALVWPIAIRFAGYGWPSESAPGFLSPRKPRVLAEPARGTAQIYIEGQGKTEEAAPDHHPNIQAEQLYPDGKDYEITSLSGDQMNQETTQVAILTPLPNPVLPGNEQGGVVRDQPFDFPIWPNPDGAADFLEKRDSYVTDRPWLMGGGKSKKLVRVHGLREFYNSMATAVNSVKKGRPYDFFQHYPTIRPNNIGLFGDQANPLNKFASIRPRDHFATVTEGDAIWTWAVANNVPIKGVADLPQSLRDLEGIQRQERTITHQLELQSTVLSARSEWRWDQGFWYSTFWIYELRTTASAKSFSDRITNRFGGSLYDALLAQTLTFQAVQDYHWITVEDLKTAAETLGFKFFYERLVAPLALKPFITGPAQELFRSANSVEFDDAMEIEVDGFQAPNPHPVGSIIKRADKGDRSYEAVRVAFVAAVNEAEADWIQDMGPPIYLVNNHAGDVLTTDQNLRGIRVIYKLPADLRYRSTLGGLNTNPMWPNDPAGFGNRGLVGHPVGAVMVQSIASAGLAPESFLILINSDSLEHDGTAFSETNYAAAAARLSHGAAVLPVKTREATLGSQAVPVVVNADTFLAADPEGMAQKVFLYKDWPLK